MNPCTPPILVYGLCLCRRSGAGGALLSDYRPPCREHAGSEIDDEQQNIFFLDTSSGSVRFRSRGGYFLVCFFIRRKLGKSGNPSPSGSGGIQGMPSTRPPSYLPGGYQSEGAYQQELPYQREERQRQSLPGLPAWALERYRPDMVQGLEPFGANLFRGNFASTYSSGLNETM